VPKRSSSSFSARSRPAGSLALAIWRSQALMFVGDVFGRNADIQTEIQRRVNLERHLFARNSRTVSSSIRTYISKPTALMWPCCSPPSRLPAPRSSRSSAAILNPRPDR
jgi:hypothetical protein